MVAPHVSQRHTPSSFSHAHVCGPTRTHTRCVERQTGQRSGRGYDGGNSPAANQARIRASTDTMTERCDNMRQG